MGQPGKTGLAQPQRQQRRIVRRSGAAAGRASSNASSPSAMSPSLRMICMLLLLLADASQIRGRRKHDRRLPVKSPIFRFAPSPNGPLHLGHALSAILNHDMAKAAGGRFLLRIEDIDLDPLHAGIRSRHLSPISTGSASTGRSRCAGNRSISTTTSARCRTLIERGLVYPAFLTRGEVKASGREPEATGEPWPRDPDGSPHLSGGRPRPQRRPSGDADAGVRHADMPGGWT